MTVGRRRRRPLRSGGTGGGAIQKAEIAISRNIAYLPDGAARLEYPSNRLFVPERLADPGVEGAVCSGIQDDYGESMPAGIDGSTRARAPAALHQIIVREINRSTFPSRLNGTSGDGSGKSSRAD